MASSNSPNPTLAASQSESQREKLLNCAERLLRIHGPDGLSIRQLARDGGVSTMGIYTLFGGKPGLMQALYSEGFTRLYEHAAAAEDREYPLKWLIGQMFAYRRFALGNVGMYRLMFGGEKRFTPADRNSRFSSLTVPIAEAYPSFGALVDAVAACQRDVDGGGTMPTEELAFIVWANLHGIISLEIAGYVHEGAALDRFKNMALFLSGYFSFDRARIEQCLGEGPFQ